MFDATTECVTESRITKYRVLRDTQPVTFADFLQLLQSDGEFREFFTGLLAASPFSAFRWETPALSRSSQDDPFEFVLLNSPGLSRQPDPRAFGDHFLETTKANDVLSFPNLGRNAQMIVPCPTENEGCYTHLASYLRDGPSEQIDRMWRVVGCETAKAVARKPRWLSTAGGGVAWLHIRIDQKPKYYGFTEYKTVRNESQNGWFRRSAR